MARTLALRAVDLDASHATARWLAAAAGDRRAMYVGKPQRYGTQYRIEAGRWVLYKVEPNVSDDERARWNVVPLFIARRRLAKIAAQMPPEADDDDKN